MWHFGTFQYHINIVDNFCKEKNCWKYQIVAEYFHKKYQKPLSWALTRAWWPSYLLPRGKVLSFFDFGRGKNPTLRSPKASHLTNFHQLSHFPNSFNSSLLNFQISTVLSEDVCLKVFVTKSWRIYEIVQKYNFHLCRVFATGEREWGERLYGNSTFLRKHRTISVTEGGLGVFVKKRCLVRSRTLFSGSWILRQL